MTTVIDVPPAYDSAGDAPVATPVPAWLALPAGFVLGLALTRTAKTAIVRRSVLARRDAQREATLEAAYSADAVVVEAAGNGS